MSLRLQDALAVACAFAVPLVVLLAAVRTSVGFWDTADLQTVAWIAGIPYPTGYPGYVVIGWLWTHAIPFAPVAARLNALSAVAVATGAATVTATALLFDVLAPLAVLGGWTFAFAYPVFARGTYADVHPLGFAVAFAALALALRWAVRGEPRALWLATILGGAALAVDNTTVLILLGAAVATFARRPPPRLAVRALAIAALIVLAAYAFLPLRSAYLTAHRADPTLALGIPPGRPFFDDHHPATLEGFRSLVMGTEWGTGGALARIVTPQAVRAALDRYGAEVSSDLPQGLLIAALIGIGFIIAGAPLAGAGLLITALVPALFGASYPAEADPERYVLALYAVAALGVVVAADRTVRAFGRLQIEPALTLACALLALAVVNDLVRGRELFALRNDTAGAALGARVAEATRNGAVVVAPWDWATPLGYAAYVDRALGNRIVVCALPQDHLDDYARWARERQVTIVADGEPSLPGYRTRRLSGGSPQVYEILPP